MIALDEDEVAMDYGSPRSAPGAAAAAPPVAQPRLSARQSAVAAVGEGDLDIKEALRAMLAAGASDLHLTSGAPPMMRVHGELAPLEGFDRLTPDALQRALMRILTVQQAERFEETLELDLSYALPGEARFRVNVYRQRDAIGAAFRMIPFEIVSLEALNMPASVSRFAQLPRGLVLVTGPTGSGKSTTLAALIDVINRQRSGHIMTIEDPIEFLHRHRASVVNQREVGTDTKSFANALRHVLRQDPDVILIGELRDLETIQIALTAAETGHLVLATLHTQDAAQTIDRIIDVFPAEQQAQVRTQLATALQGVVSQTLCRRADGRGRVAAAEVLFATPAIRNLIRDGKTYQIYSALQAGLRQGMQTMDQHLADLVRAGQITYDTAARSCHSMEELNRLVNRTAVM